MQRRPFRRDVAHAPENLSNHAVSGYLTELKHPHGERAEHEENAEHSEHQQAEAKPGALPPLGAIRLRKAFSYETC